MFNYYHILHVRTSFSLLLTQNHGIQCCHPLKVLLDASITPCNPKNELVLGNHGALYSADCAEQKKTVHTSPFGCYLAVVKVWMSPSGEQHFLSKPCGLGKKAQLVC